jgi:hypothetical protein
MQHHSKTGVARRIYSKGWTTARKLAAVVACRIALPGGEKAGEYFIDPAGTRLSRISLTCLVHADCVMGSSVRLISP